MVAALAQLGPLLVRRHSSSGQLVIVLHGGPAAAGCAGTLARGICDSFQVIEPLQRGSGGEPLTVARHVADLHAVIKACGEKSPALVGESWGAMLALAYAAAHSGEVGPIALIGCGTFDENSRRQLHASIAARAATQFEEVSDSNADEKANLDPTRREQMARDWIYNVDPMPLDPLDDVGDFDIRAHRETWDDMLRQQALNKFPRDFSAIRSSVIMLHGAQDPHPGALIRDSLLPHIPQLQYHEWSTCGHSPWRERRVRDFFRVLTNWLNQTISSSRAQPADLDSP
jgi:pimeloyl-ACP methyl ester carboxylesterase